MHDLPHRRLLLVRCRCNRLLQQGAGGARTEVAAAKPPQRAFLHAGGQWCACDSHYRGWGWGRGWGLGAERAAKRGDSGADLQRHA